MLGKKINICSVCLLTQLLVNYPRESTEKHTPVTNETKWPLPSPLWHSRSLTLPLLLPLPFRSGPLMLTTARSVLCIILLADGILILYSRSHPFEPSSPSAARFTQCSTKVPPPSPLSIPKVQLHLSSPLPPPPLI
jgi:hypothetical protein